MRLFMCAAAAMAVGVWATMLTLLSSSVFVPTRNYFHGRLAPGSVRAVLRATPAIGPHLPPVDPLKPGLAIKRAEQGFIAAGLIGEGQDARRFTPRLAVRVFQAREPRFREDHRLLEFLLHQLDFSDHCVGGEIVGKRIVIVQPDVIEGVPK